MRWQKSREAMGLPETPAARPRRNHPRILAVLRAGQRSCSQAFPVLVNGEKVIGELFY